MKRTLRLLSIKLAVVAAVLSFGVWAHAEPARQELAHAYWLLKTADHDYGGHRVNAMHAIENAGKTLGIELRGDLPERERQWKSDAQMTEALRLVRDARDKMEDADRHRVADHLERAVKELDAALNHR